MSLNVPLSHEYGRVLHANFRHFEALQAIMATTQEQWKGCGSYLMGPASLDYDPSTYEKQVLLYDQAKIAHNVLEIGVHGGHSLLIMLLANPRSRITCIDICEWVHTEQCVAYLNSAFDNRIVFLKGSSIDVLPTMTAQFDLIHVDGDHGAEAVRVEGTECHRLSAPETIFIFDDLDSGAGEGLRSHADKYAVIFAPNCPWRNCMAVRTDHPALVGDRPTLVGDRPTLVGDRPTLGKA
jgi:hypothetical protein